MASYRTSFEQGPAAFLAQPLVFQRGEGSPPRPRRPPSGSPCGPSTSPCSFSSSPGPSIGLCRAYLFLISWDKLAVRSVEVVCARPALKRQLDLAFAGKRLGNILLCDIDGLRTQVRAFVWVKEARIRKVFPSLPEDRGHGTNAQGPRPGRTA